jgi:hypothetical protein
MACEPIYDATMIYSDEPMIYLRMVRFSGSMRRSMACPAKRILPYTDLEK